MIPKEYYDAEHTRVTNMAQQARDANDPFMAGYYSGKRELLAELLIHLEQPINMILFCPRCHSLHIDQTQELCDKHDANSFLRNQRCSLLKGHEGNCVYVGRIKAEAALWTNPPHRSHACQFCGLIWRPADVPTNGVQKIATRGKGDTWPHKIKILNAE